MIQSRHLEPATLFRIFYEQQRKMSRKSRRTKIPAGANEGISRRDLIKMGVAWAALPSLPSATQFSPVLKIIRAEDLFEASVVLQDCRIEKASSLSNRFVLKPNKQGDPGIAFLVPPQHLLEEAFLEDLTQTFKIPKRGEVRAWFSSVSRLAFKFGKLASIRLTPSDLQLSLTNLLPIFPKAAKGEPGTRESWIEPITRLLITPSSSAHWFWTQAPDGEEFKPVWALQMVSNASDTVPVNLIWTQDFDNTTQPIECAKSVTPLSAKDRRDLVNVFSGDGPHIKDCSPPSAPDVPQMSPLLLSSQGAFLNANAAWDPPTGCGSLAGWKHATSQGRDHFVQVIRKYFCYPDGIPITVIKESARHFEDGNYGDGAGAFLRIRLIIKSTKTSTINTPVEMPFVREEIPEQDLPPLDLDPVGHDCDLFPCHDGWIDRDDMKHLAFWPLVRGQKLKIKTFCIDHTGKQHEVQRAFILVSSDLVEKNGRLRPDRQKKIDSAWEKAEAESDRMADLQGKSIAVAPEGKTSDTTVSSYELDLARAADAPLSAGAVAIRPFEPRLHRLKISSDSLSTISGSTKHLPVSFRRQRGLSQAEARQFATDDPLKGILTPSMTSIPGQPYLGLETPQDSGIGGEQAARFAGILQPNLNIAAIGRDTQLIAGDVQSYLSGNFSFSQLFSGAKLLGGIDLGQILSDQLLPSLKGQYSALQNQIPAWIFDINNSDPWDTADLPAVGQDNLPPDPESPDTEGSFLGWRASFDWSTSNLKPFALFGPTPGKTLLSVHCAIAYNLASGQGGWSAKGTVRDFAIAIPEATEKPDDAWISIQFDEVTVEVESGQSPRFAPRIKDGDDAIQFGQKLSFLKALQNLLKGDKGLSIDVSPTGVAVTQTIHLSDKSYGTFAISGLTLTFGIRLPFTGEPLQAQFALGRASNPFTVSVAGYSGAAFFESIVSADKLSSSLAVSLEFGGDYAADFAGIAKGRAFLRAGFYFRKDNLGNCTFRGFVRTGGHLDVLGIGGVSLLALLGLECANTVVRGFVHVEITVSIGWLSISRSFDISQGYPAPGQTAAPALLNSDPGGGTGQMLKSVTQRMSRQQWAEYWRAFA